MKYGNFYDLESLTLLNRHEGCACSIKECDVEKVNRLISRMREDRERVSLPTAGDVVTYTTRGGDYYPQAHIERGDDREVHICLLPQTPFCHENEKCTGYNTEGGPWVITGPELLLPDGIRSKQFRMWGHTGRHRNGAVLFHTFVRAAGRDSARRTFQRIPSRSVHTLGIPYGMEGTSHMGMEHAESGNAPLFPWRLPRQDTDRP